MFKFPIVYNNSLTYANSVMMAFYNVKFYLLKLEKYVLKISIVNLKLNLIKNMF